MPPARASALTPPALVMLALLALLLAAERVGLPTGWVRLFFHAIVLGALIAVLWLSRTTQERAFTGSTSALGAGAGGLVLAMMVTAAITMLAPPVSGPQWLASIIGAVTGQVLAHGLARATSRTTVQDVPDGPMAPSSNIALLRGLGLLFAGGALALAGTEAARLEVARLLTVGMPGSGLAATQANAALFPALLALIAVLAGGIRASLIQATAFALAAVAAFGLTLAIGLIYLGPLPLPGQSEPATLAAIAEARQQWGITMPLHLLHWPDWTSAFGGDGLRSLVLCALIASGMSLALSPVVSVRRKSTAAVAAIGSILLPLAVVAIAGYAVEAAASIFIGASINRPPPAVIETARLGLAGLCGSNPDSAEALRLACGLSPRDTAVLAWSQVRLTSAYIQTGLSAAVGFSTTLNLFTGFLTAAWHLAVVTLGLGLAAQGLGQYLFVRSYRAAGLASLRLGLVRLSALILAAVLAFLPTEWLMATREAWLPALLAGSLALMAYWLWIALVKAPAAPSAQPAATRPRRPRSAPVAHGERP
jgi:hypothetical protein